MRHNFGDRTRFAIEIGVPADDTCVHRRVDVWAADRWLTCNDNSVYVPHFVGMLQHAVGWFLAHPDPPRRGRPYPELSAADAHARLLTDAETDNTEHLAYRFMDWGPTADNVSMHLFRTADTAVLPFSYWRPDHHDPAELGRVFVVELPVWELVRVLHEAAWCLMWAWAAGDR